MIGPLFWAHVTEPPALSPKPQGEATKAIGPEGLIQEQHTPLRRPSKQLSVSIAGTQTRRSSVVQAMTLTSSKTVVMVEQHRVPHAPGGDKSSGPHPRDHATPNFYDG